MKLDEVTEEFVRNHGLDCANKFMLPWQKIWYVLIFGFMVGLFFYRWDFALLLVNGLCALVYFSIVIFRVIAGLISLSGIGEFRISKEEANSISDEDLPIYTILVPLYKEANIANKIVRNMNQLNYPKEELDIKLLLEEDDDATQNAVKQCKLQD